MLIEDFIDGEFGFAGKTTKREETRFEEAGFGALTRWRRQLVEQAAGALPPALAEQGFAAADLGNRAVGGQADDALKAIGRLGEPPLVQQAEGLGIDAVAFGLGRGLAAYAKAGQKQGAEATHHGPWSSSPSLARARWWSGARASTFCKACRAWSRCPCCTRISANP